MKIGLVLGSGGARGLAHIGVLKILEKNNIRPNMIVGTSIGAFVGAFYSAGTSISEMERLSLSIDKKFIAKMLIPSISTSGIFDVEQIREYLNIFFGDIKIEDLKIPFTAIATDITTGEEILLTKGSLVNAILTSIAIPGIFKPVLYKQRYMVDGGLVNPLPVSVAKKLGADLVIAVQVLPEPTNIRTKKKNISQSWRANIFEDFMKRFNILSRNKNTSKKEAQELFLQSYPSIIQTLRQSLSIMENKILELHLKNNPADILIKPRIEQFDLFEFYKAKEIIAAGEKATTEIISRIEAYL